MRRLLSLNEFIKESNTYTNDIISNVKDSKIIDKNGKLLIVYRSSGNKFVVEGKQEMALESFTTSKKAALGYGKDINKYVVYLNNPLFMTNYGLDESAPDGWMSWLEVKEKYFDGQKDPYKKIQEDGYDGLVELNDKRLYHESAIYEMLHPNRITLFNPDNSKMLGSIRWYEI